MSLGQKKISMYKTKSTITKRKIIAKLGFSKINFCTSISIVREMKGQVTNWKKILINWISDKGLIKCIKSYNSIIKRPN